MAVCNSSPMNVAPAPRRASCAAPARTTAPTPARCASRSKTAASCACRRCRRTATPPARCAPRSRATPSAPITPSACCIRSGAAGPKGSGRFERVGWDEALDDIAERLQEIAARDPQAIVPYSYAGTMGLVQGESMAARFFHKLGASLLDRTICSSAGGEALAATYGGKVGMHVEHFADSRLIVIWGSNSITRTCTSGASPRRPSAAARSWLHRPASHRDRREVPPAPRAAARHRRRARARRDA